MARIPLVSEFKPQGIDKAIKEFKKLETTGQKVGFALQKAFLPAAAALGALTVAAGASVKAAVEDAAQQEELARQLKATTGATDEQVAANEAFIASMELAVAVSDAELRPALGNLVRGTGDLTSAQDLLAISLDIAAATGKDLNAVTEAMAKAAQGEMTALKRLDPSLTAVIASGADADEVFTALSETFGGAAANAADTVQGRFERMQIQLANASEAIGYALLPIIEALLPKLEAMATFVGENTDLIIGIGAAVGTFATFIVAANMAMKAWSVIGAITTAVNTQMSWSFTTLQAASGLIVFTALIGVFVILQKKFDIFGKAVDALTWYFQTWWDVVKWVIGNVIDAINLLIRAWNKLPLVDDIPEISKDFLDMGDAAEDGAAAAIPAMEEVAEVVGSAEGELERFKNQFENTGRKMSDVARYEIDPVTQRLDGMRGVVDMVDLELQGLYNTLKREDAADAFKATIDELQDKLGTDEFEGALRDAKLEVFALEQQVGGFSSAVAQEFQLALDLNDFERLDLLILSIKENWSAFSGQRFASFDQGQFTSLDPFYEAIRNMDPALRDALGTPIPTGRSSTGISVQVNMPVGSNGADVVRSIEKYSRRTGGVNIPVSGSVRS
jgi:exosortase/archaeosortase